MWDRRSLRRATAQQAYFDCEFTSLQRGHADPGECGCADAIAFPRPEPKDLLGQPAALAQTSAKPLSRVLDLSELLKPSGGDQDATPEGVDAATREAATICEREERARCEKQSRTGPHDSGDQDWQC